jgi:hypothetical protein
MSSSFVRYCGRTEKILYEKEGNIMAGYNVTALALDQHEPASRFTIAVSVMDRNGVGIQNLSESNITVRNITSDTPIAVAEFHSAGLPGFYRLLLKTESKVNAGNQVLALVVTSRQHIAGRVPEGMDRGNTMVKLNVG